MYNNINTMPQPSFSQHKSNVYVYSPNPKPQTSTQLYDPIRAFLFSSPAHQCNGNSCGRESRFLWARTLILLLHNTLSLSVWAGGKDCGFFSAQQDPLLDLFHWSGGKSANKRHFSGFSFFLELEEVDSLS